MAHSSAHRAAKDRVVHRSPAASPGNQPQGIRKVTSTPLRKSARIQQLQQRSAAVLAQDPILSRWCRSSRPETVQAQGADRKRKRHEFQPPSHQIPAQPRKRLRSVPVDLALSETGTNKKYSNPIDHWREHDYRWPKELFDPDPTINSMLARKKSSSSLRRRALGAESVTDTASDSVPYQNPLYAQHLAQCGIFMDEDEAGLAETSKEMYMSLLEAEQTVPQQSLFCDRLFRSTCRNLENRNEARVVRDIALLIVPSAEHLAAEGAADLACLIETINETWSGSIKIYGPTPKPDYSVGFRWDTFTKEQVQRLEPYIGDLEDESLFKATCAMYFPFLTCEVKCGAAALDVADRQNAHSMGIAVRAVVELFRRVKREAELHQVILGFSVSHDHRMVRIYGHYPVINGKEMTCHRHLIHAFDFTVLNGKERWTSYKFIKNVYETWMPNHFRRICSAIDELPLGVDAVPSQPSEPSSKRSGLAQEITSNEPAASEEATESENGQSSAAEPKHITPNTSVSPGGSKSRPKRKHQSSISAVEQ